MSDNCRDCPQTKNLEERFLRLEEKCQATQDKLAEIEISSALYNDRIKSLFNMLSDIKDSIKMISNKIDSLESKPGENWNDMIKTAIAVIVTAAVTYFLKQ